MMYLYVLCLFYGSFCDCVISEAMEGLTKPQWVGPTDNVIRSAGRGIELMFVCLFLVHVCVCLFYGSFVTV